MFKFFRRYNKWILAVGGTLLLIVFLIPQAIQGLSQRAAVRGASRAVVGDGDEVPLAEWMAVQEETQFLDRLGVALPAVGPVTSPSHWYLLVREADEVGMVGGNSTVGASQDQIDLVASQVGKSPQFVLDTEAKLSGVSRLIALYHGAGRISDRRLRHLARRLFHAVNAEVVVLEADADRSDHQPTEAEIEAHLAEYGDLAPGEGERGFGYRLPDRVKLEWITIPAATVREMVENSDGINGIALRRHWKRYQQSRGFPEVDDAAAVPDVVRDDLIDTLTAEKLDEIAKQASQLLANPRRGLPELDGYAILPADWSERQLRMPELAAQLQEKYGIETPIYQSMGDEWLSAADLAALDDLAGAQTDKFGDPPLDVAGLVAAAQEFGGSTRVIVQEDVAMPPLRTFDGGVHIVRIIATDASRPPASVDEVRDEIVRDLRRLDHYEKLAAEIDSVTEQARTDGLLALALGYDTAISPTQRLSLANLATAFAQMRQGFPVAQTPTPLAGLGDAPDAIETIVDHALSLPQTADLSEVSEEVRTLVIALPDHLALLVVRLLDQTPLTEETFATLVRSRVLELMMLGEEFGELDPADGAFGFDALANRHEFALRTGDDEDAEPEPTPEDGEAVEPDQG